MEENKEDEELDICELVYQLLIVKDFYIDWKVVWIQTMPLQEAELDEFLTIFYLCFERHALLRQDELKLILKPAEFPFDQSVLEPN